MGLEVLSGPSPMMVGTLPVTTFTLAHSWIQGRGLLAAYADPSIPSTTVTQSVTGLIQMDGTVYSVAAGGASFQGGQPVLDLRGDNGPNALAASFLEGIYNISPVSCVRDAAPFQQAFTGSTAVNAIGADGRFLTFTTSGTVTSSAGAIQTVEYTWPTPNPGGAVNVSRGRSAAEICVTFGDGQIRFYDTQNKTQSGGPLYTDVAAPTYYVPKWDVFVQVVGTTITVLADAVEPHAISAPTALTPIVAGNASTIQVQVTGSFNEPCVGELVAWSISSGEGVLTLMQSMTDENGNAQTVYVAPLGSTGDVTVVATVDF